MHSLLTELMQGICTQSATQTQKIAQALALLLPQESILALKGDLGSGKTTFVQGLAQAWSILDPITSPTFGLLRIYEGTRRLIHIDAYRLNNSSEVEALCLEAFLRPPYCLAIEWPQRLGDYLPSEAWQLEFKLLSNDRHSIQLTK